MAFLFGSLWWIGERDLSETALDIVIFVTLALIILPSIYVLYWSQPMSRKKMGIKAVDDAIARYKKPGEKAVGIIGGYAPDLEVDGKRYKMVVYSPGGHKDAGWLAVDLDGNVVRDEELILKLSACNELSIRITHPEAINKRTDDYHTGEKTLKVINDFINTYDKRVEFLEKRHEQAQKRAYRKYTRILVFT